MCKVAEGLYKISHSITTKAVGFYSNLYLYICVCVCVFMCVFFPKENGIEAVFTPHPCPSWTLPWESLPGAINPTEGKL